MPSYEERLTESNRYYAQYADHVKARTDKRDYSRALDAFCQRVDPTAGVVLDIGCGTGIHLLAFNARGIDALGIDPSVTMRDRCAEQGLKAIDGSFETLDSLMLPPLSGIWCAASLLHVPQTDFATVIGKIAALLPHNAPFYFTLRLGDGADWDQVATDDNEPRRYIQLFSQSYLEQTIMASGLSIADEWVEDSYWGRPAQWINMVAVKA